MYTIGKNLICLAMKGNRYAIAKIAKATPEDFSILSCKHLLHGDFHWRAEIATSIERGCADKFILLCQLWLDEELVNEGVTPEMFFSRHGNCLLGKMV